MDINRRSLIGAISALAFSLAVAFGADSPYYGVTQFPSSGIAKGHISGYWNIAGSSSTSSTYTITLDGPTGIATAKHYHANGLSYQWPSSFNSVPTVLTNNGFGNLSWESYEPFSTNMPVGSIFTYSSSTCPSDSITADGSYLSTTTYSQLYGVIGCTFGCSGDTFKVPDIRGYFVRGWDSSSVIDPYRVFGSTQSDAIKSHQHISGYQFSSAPFGYSTNSYGQELLFSANSTNGYSNLVSSPYINGTITESSETRPTNIALNYCISYRNTAIYYGGSTFNSHVYANAGITTSSVTFSSGSNTASLQIGRDGEIYASTYLYANNIGHNEGPLNDPYYKITSSNTVYIGTSTVLIRDNSSFTGNLMFRNVAGSTITVTTTGLGFIYIGYGSTNPSYVYTNNIDDLNISDKLALYRIYSDSTTVKYLLPYGPYGLSAGIQNLIRVSKIRGSKGIEWEEGLAVSETATRVVNITSGIVWFNVTRKPLIAINSTSNIATLWSHTSAGDWQETEITQYNNLWYDTPTGTQTLTTNRYAVNCVYRNVDSYNEMDIVLGTGDYTLNDALSSNCASLPVPAHMPYFYIPVAKIIVQKSASTAYSIIQLAPTYNIGTGSSITDHNNLTGLQGGQAGEYYHTTSAQYADISYKSANETISGIKTFTSSVTVSENMKVTGALSVPYRVDTGSFTANYSIIYGNESIAGTNSSSVAALTIDKTDSVSGTDIWQKWSLGGTPYMKLSNESSSAFQPTWLTQGNSASDLFTFNTTIPAAYDSGTIPLINFQLVRDSYPTLVTTRPLWRVRNGSAVNMLMGANGFITFNSSATASVTTDKNLKVYGQGETTSEIALDGPTFTTGSTRFRAVRFYDGGTEKASFQWKSAGATKTFEIGTASDRLDLYTVGTTRMTLATDGNVGIGNNAPTYKLDVTGDIRANGANGRVLWALGSNIQEAPSGYYISNRIGDKPTIFQNKISGSVTDVAVNSGNKWRFGDSTTPTETLEVNGNILAQRLNPNVSASLRAMSYSTLYYSEFTNDTSANGDTLINNYNPTASLGNIIFKFKGSEKVRFKGSGEVGIGTTTPTEKLSVNGNIKIDTIGNGLVFPDGTKQTSAAAGSADIVNLITRQTVLSSSIDSNGYANFVSSGSGLNAEVRASSSYPLVLAFANGYSTFGGLDYINIVTSTITIAVPASSTTYIYMTRDSSASVAGHYTSEAPSYGYSHPSCTAGKFSFIIPKMTMYACVGGVWTSTAAVFVGQITTGGSTVTNSTTYALRGQYDSGWFGVSSNTEYTKAHNLGSVPTNINIFGASDSYGSNMTQWPMGYYVASGAAGDVHLGGITSLSSVLSCADIATGAELSPWGSGNPTHARVVISRGW